jgi:DNA-binding XRE family transcriptional regulator
MKTGGYIYAIGAVGTSYVKIGSTRTAVEKRLKTLQTGQPFPLQTLATIAVENNLRRIERQIHMFLTEKRQHGEWFDIPMDAARLEELVMAALEHLAEAEAQRQRKRLAQAEVPVMNLSELIGERIRTARLRRDLNQSDLARAVNKPRQHISQVEQGRQQPRAELLIDIADALGVTIDYLLGRTPVPDTEADLAAVGRS